jgi:hypothetical protein
MRENWGDIHHQLTTNPSDETHAAGSQTGFWDFLWRFRPSTSLGAFRPALDS